MICICYVPIFFRISHNKNNMYFTVYWWYSHGSPWTHGILSICASMVIPLCFAGFCGSHFLWVFRYFSYARLAIVLPSSWSTILLLWPKRDLWAASWRKVGMQMIAILRPPQRTKQKTVGGCFFYNNRNEHVKNGGFFTEWQGRCFEKIASFFVKSRWNHHALSWCSRRSKTCLKTMPSWKKWSRRWMPTWAKRFAKHTFSQSESCSVLVSLSPKTIAPSTVPWKTTPKPIFQGRMLCIHTYFLIIMFFRCMYTDGIFFLVVVS